MRLSVSLHNHIHSIDSINCCSRSLHALSYPCYNLTSCALHIIYYIKKMDRSTSLIDKLKAYGVGHRGFGDPLFANDKPPPRLGVYDLDEEHLYHKVIKSPCNVPGCTFTADSLLQFEEHYNASHRYCCSQCKRVLPSPHLLDLHIQESHDSFFAVMAAKKASFCCYIEECKEKFLNADERFNHCVSAHNLPKDFRFEQKTKCRKKKTKDNRKSEEAMELDGQNSSSKNEKKNNFFFTNSKQKAFAKYSGRKFTANNEDRLPTDVNMEDIVTDLKDSLPEINQSQNIQ